MTRAIHGAPAQTLSDALATLSKLAHWVSWTADCDLPPSPFASVRQMREAAAGLRKAARLLDDAAGRTEAEDRDAASSPLIAAARVRLPPPVLRRREPETGRRSGGARERSPPMRPPTGRPPSWPTPTSRPSTSAPSKP